VKGDFIMDTPPETLTPFERLALINQFQILEMLDPGHKEEYTKHRGILEHGYTIFYADVFGGVRNELSIDGCKYVYDVLDMHLALLRSYEELPDRSGINPDDIRFRGFDGNNESKNLAFAEYLQEIGSWSEILKGGLNSHSLSTVEGYPRMLQRWAEIKGSSGAAGAWKMTADQIKKVIS
jgi:uncharacterized protein YfbU (UPF0304 family)